MKAGDIVMVHGVAAMIVEARGENYFDVLYRGQVRRYPARWLELI